MILLLSTNTYTCTHFYGLYSHLNLRLLSHGFKLGLGKSFECSNFRLFAVPHHAHFNVCACALVHSKRVVNNMCGCSSKVDVVLLTASVSFLSPVMLHVNPSRNSNRNKTSTRYKATIQFWRLSITNQGESNIWLKNY